MILCIAPLAFSTIPSVDTSGLQDLRTSLSTMRAALRSWAKYVPPYLLKSLYRNGVEATVGFRPNEVSILFCASAFSPFSIIFIHLRS